MTGLYKTLAKVKICGILTTNHGTFADSFEKPSSRSEFTETVPTKEHALECNLSEIFGNLGFSWFLGWLKTSKSLSFCLFLSGLS